MTDLEKFLIVFVVIIFLTVAIVLIIYFVNNKNNSDGINDLQEQHLGYSQFRQLCQSRPQTFAR